MRKFFSMMIAVMLTGSMFANTYWYRAVDNSWKAIAMTVSADGLYEYTQSSGDANQFKIALSADGWDFGWTYVQAGFNSTDVKNIGDYGKDNCYCWQSGSYYILVYYPNTAVNTTDKPVICAATTLPVKAEEFVGFDARKTKLGDQIAADLAKNITNVVFEQTAEGKYSVNLVDVNIEGSFSFGGVVFAYTNPAATSAAWKTYDSYIQPNGKDREIRIPAAKGERVNVVLNDDCAGLLVDGASKDFVAGDNILTASKDSIVLKSTSDAKPKIMAILPVAPGVDSTTLYFVNVPTWTAVKAFVWPAEGASYKEWPGEDMKELAEQYKGKDVYSYTFPSSFTRIIFNNGSNGDGNQTGDDVAVWNQAKPYFYDGVWYEDLGDIDLGEEVTEGIWKVTDDTPMAANSIYVNNNLLKVKAAFATAYETFSSSIDFEGNECNKAIFVRSESYPTVAVPAGIEYEGATSLLITAREDVEISIYYRRQFGDKDQQTSGQNDKKDLRVFDHSAITVSMEGEYSEISRNVEKDRIYAIKKLLLQKGHSYTIAAKGTTPKVFGIAYTKLQEKYYLVGTMNDWAIGANEFIAGNEDSYSVEVPLYGDYKYEFKVVYKKGSETVWYGIQVAEGQQWAPMVYGNSTDWWLNTKVGDKDASNVGLQTTQAGSYKFIYKANENHEISVVIPEPKQAVPDEKIAKLNGVFSIAKDGRAQFSRGNLQYNYATQQWFTAEKQYEFLGEDPNLHFGDENYIGSIDLFGWSNEKSNYGLLPSNKDADFVGGGAFKDWGDKFEGGEWSTLSTKEWKYLLDRKDDAGHKLWTMIGLIPEEASVDTLYGLVLFPDNWVQPADVNIAYGFYDLDDEPKLKANTFTYAQWDTFEAAGAVFLPTAGSRAGHIGNTIGFDGKTETDRVNPKCGWYCWVDNIGWYGYYWNSTMSATNDTLADYLILPAWSEGPTLADDDDLWQAPQVWSREKRRGNSVRLVQKTYDPHYYIVGEMNEWKIGANEMAAGNEDTLLLAMNLDAERQYEFKVVRTHETDTVWYGIQVPEGQEWSPMAYGNSTGWWLKADADKNIGLQTTKEAEYTFIFKANENNEISVVIPEPDPLNLEDGFYLISAADEWKPANLTDEKRFRLNEGSEYKLTATLAAGDQIKVVEIENKALVAWYPDGEGTEYTVDAAHAGENKDIYFQQEYKAEWEAFGGYFWMGENTPSAILNTEVESVAVKLLRDGQVIIRRGERVYTIMGQLIK